MVLINRTITSNKISKVNKKNVVVLAFFLVEFLIGILAFSNIPILIILAIVPPVMSFAYLQLKLVNEDELKRKSTR